MDSTSRSALNEQISEEAAEWFVEFRSGDVDTGAHRKFEAWVRSSPEHLRAYLEYAALWNDADAVDASGSIDVDELIRRSRDDGNVVGLSHHVTDLGTRPRPRTLPRRRHIAIAASLLLMVAVGWAAFLQLHSVRGQLYATAAGEQRSIRLADGSTVELNSRSRLRVQFVAGGERHVELLEGQALFEVTRDPSRPFIVQSDETLVRAVGTRFDVNRMRAATIVTVIEGKVAVSGASSVPPPVSEAHGTTERVPEGQGTPVFVSAGEKVSIGVVATSAPAPADVAAVTAWTHRQLVLASASLEEVAEEFNRYSERKLIVSDTASEGLRLTGVFETDPNFLLRYLRARPDITVVETQDTVRITHHEPR